MYVRLHCDCMTTLHIHMFCLYKLHSYIQTFSNLLKCSCVSSTLTHSNLVECVEMSLLTDLLARKISHTALEGVSRPHFGSGIIILSRLNRREKCEKQFSSNEKMKSLPDQKLEFSIFRANFPAFISRTFFFRGLLKPFFGKPFNENPPLLAFGSTLLKPFIRFSIVFDEISFPAI